MKNPKHHLVLATFILLSSYTYDPVYGRSSYENAMHYQEKYRESIRNEYKISQERNKLLDSAIWDTSKEAEEPQYSPFEAYQPAATKNATMWVTASANIDIDTLFEITLLKSTTFFPILKVDTAERTIAILPQIETIVGMVTPWEKGPYTGTITVTPTANGTLISTQVFAKPWHRKRVDTFFRFLSREIRMQHPSASVEVLAEKPEN